jgi:predicted transcriptional regulator
VPDEPRNPYQYAIIRVVPHVERGEAINVGVVLLCRSAGFVGARTALDEGRLRAIAADADVAMIERHLEAIDRVAEGDPRGGPIARLSSAERFHWLVSPASTIIQPSEVHTGLTDDPAAELERLFKALVR